MSDSEIIRHDAPHQVTMKEGSTMAVGKKAEAIEPSVRKVLAAEEGLMLEHKLDDHRLAVPEGQGAAGAIEQPSFERDIHHDRALAPAADAASGPLGGLLVKRALDDHNVALPTEAAQAAAEHEVSAARARPAAEAGPLIPQFENDHFVVVPPPLAEKAPQALDRGSSRDPQEAPPVQDSPAQADSAKMPELSEAMTEMLQMNFPARVVKLKIENDKVRTKLDSLQGIKPK
ncbi:MAG: hypothetical protein RLZZ03_1329 [Pseudomonadota bacterium]|jgi:hypothetical protein